MIDGKYYAFLQTPKAQGQPILGRIRIERGYLLFFESREERDFWVEHHRGRTRAIHEEDQLPEGWEFEWALEARIHRGKPWEFIGCDGGVCQWNYLEAQNVTPTELHILEKPFKGYKGFEAGRDSLGDTYFRLKPVDATKVGEWKHSDMIDRGDEGTKYLGLFLDDPKFRVVRVLKLE